MTIKLPELAEDHVRLMGDASKMRSLSAEQIDELNVLLRSTDRKDRRRAERVLKKLGIQAVLGSSLRDASTVS